MRIDGQRIYIRFYGEGDAPALLELHVRNREFFQRYSPLKEEDFYTLESRLAFIRDCRRSAEKDERYFFGVFLQDTDELIGSISMTEVQRGALQCCWIGYSLDKPHNGKGYMTEGVRLAVRFAFDCLQLHRIEAGAMPHNLGSIRVLEKAGFQKEGLARKNVRINGKWEDHVTLAIVSDREDI